MSLAPSPVWGLARPKTTTAQLLPVRVPSDPAIRIHSATHPLPPRGDGVPRARRMTTVPDVIAAAMWVYGVGHEDFIGDGRHPVVVECRMVAWSVCRWMTRASYPEIAVASWRPNHSTVITAVRRFERKSSAGRTSGHRDAVGVPLWAMAIRVVEAVQRAARAAEEVA